MHGVFARTEGRLDGPSHLPARERVSRPRRLFPAICAALLLVGACLFSCMPQLQAIDGGDGVPESPSRVDAIPGVTLYAFGDAWDLEPKGLPRRVTPIEIVVVNESRRDVQVRVEDFRLLDSEGRPIGRLSPFQVTHGLAERGRCGYEPRDWMDFTMEEGIRLALAPAVHGTRGNAAEVARGRQQSTYLGGARSVVAEPGDRPRGQTVRVHGAGGVAGTQGYRTRSHPAPHGYGATRWRVDYGTGWCPGPFCGWGPVSPAWGGGAYVGWLVGPSWHPGRPLHQGGWIAVHPGGAWTTWSGGWHGPGWHARGPHGWQWSYGWRAAPAPYWHRWYAPPAWSPYSPWLHPHVGYATPGGWSALPDSPPPPEAGADLSQMQLSSVALRDSSLGPGEATGGFIYYQRVPRGELVTLEWSPRSWRDGEGLRTVTVRMQAR